MKFQLFKKTTGSLLLAICLISCSKSKGSGGEVIVDPDPTPTETITLNHPCMLHTAEDFAFVKTKVNANAQPWKAGYDVLAASSYANANYNPSPVIKLVRGGGSREEPDPDNYGSAYRDVAAAYQLALRWKITGDDSYAAKAVSILNAWANTCTSITGDSNKFLASGIYGYQFANAAEILRDYSGWNATDFTKFKTWMVNLWYPLALDFLERHNGTCDSHYWANWDIANMNTVLAIGILTDDKSKINFAIQYFKKGVGSGNIDHAVAFRHNVNGEDLGQCQESGRDQGHATLVISLFGSFCQMAYNVGVDLFAYENNKVLSMCEYVAKYNVNMAYSVPYTPYKNCDAPEQTVISTDQRGTIRPSWELIYNHYKAKGVAAKYSQEFAEKVRPEGGGGNYGPNSGGFDQLGFGTLMYSK
ncbi:MAG TPA: alginate lyase family protein [Pelobium sp.]|nr:alginate lyase family protein [Pelobium sp.]